LRSASSITRKDVAKAAGVSTFTVSQALAGKPGVKDSTREKVERVAREMGYRPNAAAAALASKKRTGGRRMSVAKVARVHYSPGDFLESCNLLDLSGTLVDLQQYRSPEQLLNTLWNRGVDGLFVSFDRTPWSEEEWKECDWSRFSIMKSGRIFSDLPFHLVRHSAFDFMRESLRRMEATRAEKTAVLLFPSGSEADDEARLGAVLTAQQRFRKQGRKLSWRVWEAEEPKEPDPGSLRWLEREAPDQILSFVWPIWYPLREAGWRFPEDAGYAAVLGPNPDIGVPEVKSITGCDTADRKRIEIALEHLREMISRGERGFPVVPMEYTVEPQWVDGATLRTTSGHAYGSANRGRDASG
jgi:DNA-binding LacI/PurR family transcriptional regulator